MKEDIISMAREADIDWHKHWNDDESNRLERFAALVADAEAKRMHDEGMVTVGYMRQQIAAEREACAKAAEDFLTSGRSPLGRSVAAAIRARGEKDAS
jgi:hypothetical protein